MPWHTKCHIGFIKIKYCINYIPFVTMHLQGVHWRPRKCFAEMVISKQITGLETKIP